MKFIQDYKIEDIQPWERNPRKNDEAVKKLIPLLKEHGFINPVIIDQDGILRAGHTRIKAATELGMETVPALIVNFKDKEHAIAYGISDNKSNEWAEWDFKELKELISELDNYDFDLEMTGFSLDEMGDILTYEPKGLELEDENEETIETGEIIKCPKCGYEMRVEKK
jgi:ParB-like chromosome segregation protein Spo0J